MIQYTYARRLDDDQGLLNELNRISSIKLNKKSIMDQVAMYGQRAFFQKPF